MKAEKEPEEFEFGCEDLTKDWFDEISDLEAQEEKSECDETDFWDNEQDGVEPDSEPDKAGTGGIWDWDIEDYWAYGKSERSLLEMAHKDMLCIAGLLEVMDSLTLLSPCMTSPSAAIRSPGRTRMTSPACREEVGTV